MAQQILGFINITVSEAKRLAARTIIYIKESRAKWAEELIEQTRVKMQSDRDFGNKIRKWLFCSPLPPITNQQAAETMKGDGRVKLLFQYY